MLNPARYIIIALCSIFLQSQIGLVPMLVLPAGELNSAKT
jgi:hypothetical protein